MISFKLTADDDLAIENGNFVLITGIDAYSQRLRANLQTFQGEWFLDASVGIPYFQEIFSEKSPELGVLNSVYSDALLSTEGTQTINRLQFEQDNQLRQLFVTFDVQGDDGLVSETLQI